MSEIVCRRVVQIRMSTTCGGLKKSIIHTSSGISRCQMRRFLNHSSTRRLYLSTRFKKSSPSFHTSGAAFLNSSRILFASLDKSLASSINHLSISSISSFNFLTINTTTTNYKNPSNFLRLPLPITW